MKNIFLLFVFLFLTSNSFSEELIRPVDSVVEASKDESLKGLVWNRYTTENFTILSIDNNQGKWLNSNIENIKSWCLKRWGITNFKFQKECRIMVVPNKELLKKLFNLSESKYEVRKIKDEIQIIALWLVIDSEDDLVDEIPYFVSICSLKEMNLNNLCLINGISLLNQSVNNIKNIKNENIVFNDFKILNLLSVDEEKYKKMNFQEKKDFSNKSLILCLMLKKEFGENKFLKFLTSNKNKEDSLSFIYKFTPNDFDKSYNRYCKDLYNELKLNKVPNTYLDIKKSKD